MSLGYRDNGIELVVVPCTRRHRNAFIFLDYIARAHRARAVRDHMQFRKITTPLWPAKSLFVGYSQEMYLEMASQATGHQRAR